MVNGLFKEISEEEMMSVNGGCGGGGSPYAGPMPCQECKDKGAKFVKDVIVQTTAGALTGGVPGAVVALVATCITSVPEPHSEHAH